ncbi:hypothetical protein NKR23_g277 [Pleurostoma richardsiae]|uniref:Alpha/beta hydrolase fold-3 domain-containing protein n=1 Tax=Pleurostoma richardsiae TaxID=41990 RepID=A0AA38VQM7_9PEZI|nr:hypothetical protein NKR23_g277 [Pleurostoma richardsiae]
MTRPGRDFAAAFNVVVVCPSYHLSSPDPEVRWPASVHSAWGVLSWLSENAEREFGVSLEEGFVVGGHSAGSNLAAAVTGVSLFGDDGTYGAEFRQLPKPITGLFVNCPLLLDDDILPQKYKEDWASFQDNYHLQPLGSHAIIGMKKAYAPDFRSRWWSPTADLTKSSARGVHFPPCHINACGLDPLRDDAIVFEKVLAARGDKTNMIVFPDDGHAAWMAMPFPHKSKDPTSAEGTMLGMEWLLKGRR